LGKASTKDWVIRDYAIEGDFVLVTNNATDFQALYAATDLHPGLVIVVPNVALDKQVLLRAAQERISQSGDVTNKVLEVDISQDEITLALYDFSADE
jgi:predicted nuclease of predicted toxin-antitoxin system